MAASFLVGSQLYKVNCPPSEYLWEHLGLLPKQPLLHARVCSWSPCEVGGGVCRKRPLPPSTGQRSGIFLSLPSQKHVTQPLPIFLARLGLAAAGSTAVPLPRACQSPVLRPASGLEPLVSHGSSRPGGLHPCLEMRFPLKTPRCSLPGVLLPVDIQLPCRPHSLGVGPDWILNVCFAPSHGWVVEAQTIQIPPGSAHRSCGCSFPRIPGLTVQSSPSHCLQPRAGCPVRC